MTSEVIVFHDETEQPAGVNISGHCIVIIPLRIVDRTGTIARPISALVEQIALCRSLVSPEREFHFNRIKGPTWLNGDVASRNLILLSISAFRNVPGDVVGLFGCKLSILFYKKSPLLREYGGIDQKERELRYFETMLRLVIGTALNNLYSGTNHVIVKGIITDASSLHRDIDKRRALQPLLRGSMGSIILKPWVKIDNSAEIVPNDSDHMKYPDDPIEREYASCIQFVDMMLGASACHFYNKKWAPCPSPLVGGNISIDKKCLVAQPLRDLFESVAGQRRAEYLNSMRVAELHPGRKWNDLGAKLMLQS